MENKYERNIEIIKQLINTGNVFRGTCLIHNKMSISMISILNNLHSQTIAIYKSHQESTFNMYKILKERRIWGNLFGKLPENCHIEANRYWHSVSYYCCSFSMSFPLLASRCLERKNYNFPAYPANFSLSPTQQTNAYIAYSTQHTYIHTHGFFSQCLMCLSASRLCRKQLQLILHILKNRTYADPQAALVRAGDHYNTITLRRGMEVKAGGA